MAIQSSLLRFTGVLGDKIGYRSRNKNCYLFRSKPEQVNQTPATKRAAKDFGTASKCSALIRHALKDAFEYHYDGFRTNRLNTAFIEALSTDTLHRAGRRKPDSANMDALKRFRFNSETSAQHLLGCTPVVEHGDNNSMRISLPDITFNNCRALRNVTHIKIHTIALSVNFAQQVTRQLESETVVLSPHESDLSATLTLHPDKKDTTLILLEVQSCYEVNGQLYIAQNSKGQALDIITILPAGQQPEMKKKKVARSKKKVIIGARGQHEPESTEERMDITATDVDSWPEG